MKKIKLIAFLFIATLASNATVRTVNNNGGAQFTDLPSAITAAVSGDTIYVCGSATAYSGTITTKTNLVFIGAGYNPQKQNPVKTNVSGSWYIGNGNTVSGFEINNIGNSSSTMTNVKISRCKLGPLNGAITYVNCMFDNCLLSTIVSAPFSSSTFNGLIFSNCLFHATTTTSIINVCVISGNLTFDHCAFIKEGGAINLSNTNMGSSGGVFTNNIFVNIIPPTSGTNYQYTSNYSSANLSAYGSGNIVYSTWPFVTPQASVTGTFQFTWDFHLTAGSPLITAGTFGTEIGLYGGPVPFIPSGEPPVPQIDIMMLNGTQFTPGGTMGVQFQSTIGN